MKKSLYSIFALMAMLVAFTSCEKDEVENTATVEMAGEWHVHVSLIGPDGKEITDDWFGDGDYNIATSNTADNIANEMWLQDAVCYFYPYQVKIDVDPSKMTFSSKANSENLYGPSAWMADNIGIDDAAKTVTITDGIIKKNGTTTPSGQPADYIEFYVSFSSDPFFDYPELHNELYGDSLVPPAKSKLKVSGFRYTGFTEDE